ncbi:BLUF domain-containing protein [Wenyingzhuangia sp. 2_MG-2023]|uniref:BLUF domain-containing protein n=1 Tax=Wenyingzhuangia sp. 2_MG-2023 TaxID=3062639 RepID=UPI0026E223A9|nr:BLUF domain-containing protein [Wenyingzhuangia sp. 2_MG-2023]MDO6738660.1 BLUF domain-containing protein [Wenyingzhuangia sp. 2_MG-2023]
MYELVYESFASLNLNNEKISEILETARKFNKENNVSGCLIYHNDKFIQILEGDQKTIETLFSSIKKDIRHHNILLFHKGPIKERNFNLWNMAYIDLSTAKEDKIERELFKTNLLAYSEIIEKTSQASAIFWDEVKSILK